MKSSIYFLIILFCTLSFAGCGDDKGNPSFDDDELPKIYMEWAPAFVYTLGEEIKFKAIVSPNGGMKCRWLVNDKVVSETEEIRYKIESSDPFTLRFEVELRDLKNFRTAEVTVIPPATPENL